MFDAATTIKTAVANAVVTQLDKLAAEHGEAVVDATIVGQLIGLQIWLKNVRGPEMAYGAFQALADDVAATMIASRS